MKKSELSCQNMINLVVVCVVIFFGIGFFLSELESATRDNAAHNERMDVFGEDIMSLCENPEPARRNSRPGISEPVKVLILENGSNWGHVYMDKILDSWIATSVDELDYIVCIDKKKRRYSHYR